MGRLAQLPLDGIEKNFSTGSFPLGLLNFGTFAAELGCYSPPDVMQAHRLFNANCGPASFAAVYRAGITEIMPFFPHFPSRDWTTIGDMKRALQAAALSFSDVGTDLPEYGMALLQLRVNDRPLHRLFSLSQTHWVGVCRECFYDVNWGGWLPISLWKQLVLPRLRFGIRRVCGWEIRNSLSVSNQAIFRAVHGLERTVARTTSPAACMVGAIALQTKSTTQIPVGMVAEHRACAP